MDAREEKAEPKYIQEEFFKEETIYRNKLTFT